ncbi:peptidylprolyl isomerase [Beijerinckia sp. L45]|uniref:peptidylprolyl isomerase n=1 Tax=Beijerinckia sp. L45 TaxID=1641855 RepID=UPI00131C0F42|nr:peptidylprolyl isomerase [Beijerinckia sp. L45]
MSFAKSLSSLRPARWSVIALSLAIGSVPAASFAQPAPTPAPATPAPAAPDTPKLPPETVLAKVNGKNITQLDLDLAAEDIGSNLAPQLTGKAKDAYLLDYLIDGNLVAQKAAAAKVDQAPEFAQKLAYAKDKLLMESQLTDIAKNATSDTSLHAIYDEAAKAQKPQEEIHARHILVATEGDAQAALKRLKAGEDFAKVAKDMSKDPGSEGGELGWFTKDRMVPAFADAAFKLKDNEISEPVKTQFGWHVIQLEGRRQKTFPAFDQVKDQIARYAVQKAQSDLIVALRKDAKIERTAAAPPADAPVIAAPGDAAPAPTDK